jgi:hypothetical protein
MPSAHSAACGRVHDKQHICTFIIRRAETTSNHELCRHTDVVTPPTYLEPKRLSNESPTTTYHRQHRLKRARLVDGKWRCARCHWKWRRVRCHGNPAPPCWVWVVPHERIGRSHPWHKCLCANRNKLTSHPSHHSCCYLCRHAPLSLRHLRLVLGPAVRSVQVLRAWPLPLPSVVGDRVDA